MYKKTIIAFVALLSILAVALTGWIHAESKAKNPGSLPEGLYSWAEYFHGYPAYLDQEIHLSVYHGTSMSPTFDENDLVIWVKADARNLKIGDIIIFQHPTLPAIDNVMHRIVEVQSDGGTLQFRTKGDNISSPDRFYVPEANIHGLVIGAIYRDNSR